MEKLEGWDFSNMALHEKINEIVDYIVEQEEYKKKLLEEFERVRDDVINRV